LAFTLIAACDAADPVEDAGPPPSLSAEQEVDRMQKCMNQIDKWRSKGVWIHGGVQPAVNRDAWAELGDDDKQEIADIAACIDSSGKFEPREVQIVSEGFKVPIEKIQSDNLLLVDRYRKGE
jgi:hypothetical protein